MKRKLKRAKEIAALIIVLALGMATGAFLTQTYVDAPRLRELGDQAASLQKQVTALMGQLTAKTDEIAILQAAALENLAKYDDLLAAHNIANNPNDPNNKITILKDLIIRVKTDRAVCSLTDDVMVQVDIYYMDGTPFRGSFNIVYEHVTGSCSISAMQVGGTVIHGVSFGSWGAYNIYITNIVAWNGLVIQMGIIEGTQIQVLVK